MPPLSQVLAALLRDIAQAQALADSHARDVNTASRADPLLASQPLAAPRIGHVDLELRLAVGGPPGPAGSATPGQVPPAQRVASAVLAGTADRVRDLAALVREPEPLHVLERTLRAPESATSLAGSAAQLFARHSTPPTADPVARATALATIAHGIETALLAHPAAGLLARLGGSILADIRRDILDRTAEVAGQPTAPASPGGETPDASLDVIVDAGQLQAVPPGLVSTLRLAVRMDGPDTVADFHVTGATDRGGANV